MGGSAERREEKREFFFQGSSPEGAMRGFAPHKCEIPRGAIFLGSSIFLS